MSEIKLNLLDSHTLVVGTVHGSTGDRLVAALSAEPETIEELEAAFKRFEKDGQVFGIPPCHSKRCEIDDRPWDAGILVIDLAARIVACESTYCSPSRGGTVEYHDGTQCTGFPLKYRLSNDWLILDSTEEYEARCEDELERRTASPPLDARAILYGEPLLDFILQNVRLLDVQYTSVRDSPNTQAKEDDEPNVRYALACRDLRDTQLVSDQKNPGNSDQNLRSAIMDIHRRWLMTPRDDLRGQSPREVLFAKQNLIDSDLDSRMSQWSYFLEEPPCLSRDSYAYRFAGFGTHEWVMYYDLVRFLIWQAVDLFTVPTTQPGEDGKPNVQYGSACRDSTVSDERVLIFLGQLKNKWLSTPHPQLDGSIPVRVIDNERRRRPEAMTGRSMVIDEDCPCCKWMGDLSEAGLEITFCHFDGSHMEDEFAFSWFATLEEWEEEQRNREQWDRERELSRKESEQMNSPSDQLPDEFDIPF